MKRLPISPLPEKPTWLDRIEHGLQWCIHWFVFTDDKHPCLAGILTGLGLMPWTIGLGLLVFLVLKIIS